MRRVISALVIAVALAVPTQVAAQSSADVVEQVDVRGYATETGVAVDVNRLDQTARDLNADGVALVLLASEFANGNDILAVDVVELAEREWTVLVLSPAGSGSLDIGYASATLAFDRLDAAADAALAQSSRDPLDFATAFAADLGGAGSSGSASSDSSGGGSGFLVFLIIIVVIGLGLFLWSRRSKSDVKGKVEAAKGELNDDLAAVANDILALGERAGLDADSEASEHFRTANEIYLEVDEGLAKATTLDAVDDLDDALELAGWHLDVSEAILDGDPIPEKPRTEEVWEMDSGPAASSLPGDGRGGSRQAPRRAPAPAGRAELPTQFPRPAPRRRGGGGLGSILGGMLGGVLSSGGLSGGGSRGRRSRRGGIGGIGGDISLGGPRGRSGGGLRPAPRSRPSGGSARRPSTRRRSAAGRGRRRG